MWFVLGCAAYQIRSVDVCCAHTTIRLWHELHVQRNIPHDFVAMLSPAKEGRAYRAAVMHDEVRAVALCDASTAGAVRLRSISHAPNQLDAAIALLADYDDDADAVDWLEMKKQPRWFLELLFRQPSWQNRTNDATRTTRHRAHRDNR